MVAPLVVLQMRKLALIHGKPFEFDRCSQSLTVLSKLDSVTALRDRLFACCLLFIC